MGALVLYIQVNGLRALKYVPQVGNSEKRGCREALAPQLHISAASRPFEKLLLNFVRTAVPAKQVVDDLQIFTKKISVIWAIGIGKRVLRGTPTGFIP